MLDCALVTLLALGFNLILSEKKPGAFSAELSNFTDPIL